VAFLLKASTTTKVCTETMLSLCIWQVDRSLHKAMSRLSCDQERHSCRRNVYQQLLPWQH